MKLVIICFITGQLILKGETETGQVICKSAKLHIATAYWISTNPKHTYVNSKLEIKNSLGELHAEIRWFIH